MTDEAFDLIIYGSFNYPGTSEAYFEGKRESFECTRGNFDIGIRAAFNRLKDELNSKDYDRTVYRMSSGEIIDVKLDDRKQSADLEGRYKKIEHPYTKSIDLNKKTNGRFDGILTSDHIPDLRLKVNAYLLTLESAAKPTQNYGELLKALSGYISGISDSDFTSIIEHHRLTPGTPRAIWTTERGSKSTARYFADILRMTIPEFNLCFSFADRTKLEHHDAPSTNKTFKKILKTHLNK